MVFLFKIDILARCITLTGRFLCNLQKGNQDKINRRRWPGVLASVALKRVNTRFRRRIVSSAGVSLLTRNESSHFEAAPFDAQH